MDVTREETFDARMRTTGDLRKKIMIVRLNNKMGCEMYSICIPQYCVVCVYIIYIGLM